MANKLRITFFIFAVVVSILFCVFVFLMTTVNPPRESHGDGEIKNVTKNETKDETEEKTKDETKDDTKERLRRMESVASDAQVSENKTKVLKERRSIDDSRTTKDGGVVVMRVVDHEGRPRIELVMYPNNPSDWKIYKVDNIPGPVHSELEIQRTALMPEDTIVVENEISSHNLEYKLDSLESSNTARDVISMKSVETNKVKIFNSDQGVTGAKHIVPSIKENKIPFEGSAKTVDSVSIIDNKEESPKMDKYFTEEQSTVAASNIVPWSSAYVNIWKSNSIDINMHLDAQIEESTRMPDKNVIIETNANTETDSTTITGLTEKTKKHTSIDVMTHSVIQENVTGATKEISNVTPFEVIVDNDYTDVNQKNIANQPMIDENVNTSKTTNSSNFNIESVTEQATNSKKQSHLLLWKGLVNVSTPTNSFNEPDIYTNPHSKTDEGDSQASSELSEVLEENSGYVSTDATLEFITALL